jgi:hypothetical protein
MFFGIPASLRMFHYVNLGRRGRPAEKRQAALEIELVF